jgi:GAF domain-containing protein
MVLHHTDPDSAFAEFGRIRLAETDLPGVLTRVAELAQVVLPADQVSITLVRAGQAYTAAATGDLALRLDERQYALESGPCLRAAAGTTVVSVPDTAADPGWDGWAAEAAAAGMGSVLSVGLPIQENVTGAVNSYARQPRAFDDDALRVGQRFAGYAAVALANAHLHAGALSLSRQLQAAMEHRAVIEQAKGIIMGLRRCSADDAFAVLTRLSQDANRKVRDVAAALVARVERGEAPGTAESRVVG